MEFHERPLLNYPDLTLILLKTAKRGEVSLQDCLDGLRRNLARAAETPDIPDAELLRHLAQARRDLMHALLLAPVGSGRVRITDRGRRALKEHPMGLDVTVLAQFPEFRRLKRHHLEEPFSHEATAMPEYDDGYAAFRAGKDLADNPHAFETAAHLAWENGWFQARDDDVERRRL